MPLATRRPLRSADSRSKSISRCYLYEFSINKRVIFLSMCIFSSAPITTRRRRRRQWKPRLPQSTELICNLLSLANSRIIRSERPSPTKPGTLCRLPLSGRRSATHRESASPFAFRYVRHRLMCTANVVNSASLHIVIGLRAGSRQDHLAHSESETQIINTLLANTR